MYYRKYTYSGPVCEVEEIRSLRKPGEKYIRQKGKLSLTPEQLQQLNEINAQKKVSQSINTNFTEKDLFVTDTYARRPKDPEKELRNYLRRIRTYFKKNGLGEFKWIAVTEIGDKGQIHHHIIMTGCSRDIVTKLWGKGRVLISNLDGGDYTGLAHYILKDIPKEHKKRWTSSRNLAKPIVKYRQIKRIDPKRPVPTPKGYRMIDYQVYSSDRTGSAKYLRCIRDGAVDIAQGDGWPPDEEDENDAENTE